MYNVTATYDSKVCSYAQYDKIIKIMYKNDYSENITVENEEILKHNFPCNKELHLFSDNCSYILNPKYLIDIRIEYED